MIARIPGFGRVALAGRVNKSGRITTAAAKRALIAADVPVTTGLAAAYIASFGRVHGAADAQGGNLESWADLSGNNRHAICAILNNDSRGTSFKPGYSSSGAWGTVVTPAGQDNPNGVPAITFNSVQLLDINSPIFTSSHNWTMYGYLTLTGNNARRVFGIGNGALNASAETSGLVINQASSTGTSSNLQFIFTGGTNFTSPTFNAGVWFSFCVYDDGTNQRLEVNGAPVGSALSNTPSFTGVSGIGGAIITVSRPMFGSIAAALFYNTTHTAAQRLATANWMTNLRK